MEFILLPFRRLMNRLKYPQKFTLIFLLFFIPIVMTLSLIIFNIQNDITKAKDEKIGLESILKLQTSIQYIQQHRGLSATFLGGDTSKREEMNAMQSEVKRAISEVDEFLSANDEIADLEHSWGEIKDAWSYIEENAKQFETAESFMIHTELVENILALTTSIADDTNLSLDSDVVRHHLGKIIVDNLINSTEYMGQARAVGSNVLAAKGASPTQEMDLIFLSRIMTEHLAQIQQSMDIIFEGNEDVRQTISTKYNDAMDASLTFSTLITDEILEKQSYTYQSSDYFDQATLAIDKIYSLIASNAELFDRLLDEEIDYLSLQRNVVVFANFAAMIMAVILFIAFYQSVKESINRIKQSTIKISEGDLRERIKVDTKDETKGIEESINKMMDSLQQLIKSNQDLSHDLTSSAEELSAASNECTRASEQISSITQTVANGAENQMNTVSKVNDSIQSTATHIHEVSSSSEKMLEMFEHTASSTDRGVQVVGDVLTSMNDIHSTVQATANIIKKLGDSSNKIEHIVSVITDISSQTNLLALNAAIEASRAGEHGKGFAVVAEEVRKLAEQSNHSAEEISQLIHRIQTETIEAVRAMDEGTGKVNIGLEKVTEVNDVFQSINRAIIDVKEMVQSITSSVDYISIQSGQITDAMENVKQTAEGSAVGSQECSAASEEQLATMEEISASAESLSEMAERLQVLINRFKV